MNKKNIGAALSLIAAVTAGATAYASTVNNLDSDKNTNSMITPNYTDNIDYVSLVQSDYTKDLKNTSIAKEKRIAKTTKDDQLRIAEIEEAAYSIVAENIIKEKESSDTYDQVLVATEDEQVPESNEEEQVLVANEEEIINEDLSQSEATLSEEIEDEVLAEVAGKKSSNDLVLYDQTNLDDALKVEDDQILADTKEEIKPQTSYMEENAQEASDLKVENENNNQAQELIKYVNTKALNVRSSKSSEDTTNIVNTVLVGDKLSGSIDGDWFKTNDGFVKLSYLSDTYPQALIDQINKENVNEEAKQSEEAKKSSDQELNNKKNDQASQNESQNQESSKNEAEEIPVEPKGESFTGWVYNTGYLNVRDKAINGNIIGTLNKGDEVSGEISDGWVKFDYKGKTAYTSARYLTTQQVNEEVKETEQVSPAKEEVKVEEVKDEQEVKTEESNQAPNNNNGVAIANIASQFIGYPYVWGSSNPATGFDCSGLVVHTYKQLGVSLPHSSAAQFNNGYAVDYNNLKPGDLIFFAIKGGGIDHVGIITGTDGTFIHASTPKSGVRYDNVYNGYYQSTFRGARRIF